MVEIDGEQVGPVGIRYKGSVGAFQPPCSTFGGGPKLGKCSLKVAFDYLDEEARYHGVKKLNFHAMNADPSQLRERLVYAMFRENGVASPRVVHARLLVNGLLEGLFALVEQIDGRFTRSRFTEGGEGNLYKEVWPMHDDGAVYLSALESNRDEMPSADRMLAFKAAIEEGADSAETWIDREYLLRYLAADRVTINDDGAMHWWCTPLGQGNNPGGIGNHNYYWYEAETAQRFWLIPWDADMALAGVPQVIIMPEWRMPGTCTCAGGGFSSIAPVCDPLISTWASWTADYEAAVDDFIAGPFSEANVNAKLAAWTAQIEPVVMESEGLNSAPFFASWQAATESLRSVIDNARTNRGSQY
jgi:spore coat protein CotH